MLAGQSREQPGRAALFQHHHPALYCLAGGVKMLGLASDARDQQPGGQFLVVPVSLLQPGQQRWRDRRDPAYPVDEGDEGSIGEGVARPVGAFIRSRVAGIKFPGILAASAAAARCSAKL